VSRGRALGVSLLVALAVWVFVFKAAPRMPDFEVYWKAGARAARAEPLYRPDDGHFQFKYLPAFAVLAIPLAFFPLPAAEALWFSASVILLVVLLALAVRLPPDRRKPARWLIVIAVVALGKFYAHELVLGQVNMLFAVVTCSALLAMKTNREAAAGVLVTLAIIIKPYAVLLLPWLIARRQVASSLAACAGLVAALLLPAMLYGFDGNVSLHREWWRTVTETTAPNLSVNDNVSLAAMYFRWFGPGALSQRVTLVTAVALLAVAAVVFLRRRGVTFPEGLEGGLLLTLMPLLSPQGWDYVFLISTPAIVYLANYEMELPRALRIVTIVAVATIGLSLFDLMGRTAYYAFMRWSFISLCFFVVIAALAALRFRRVA
jgi:arabinofuranan 3-O-arabinosyltransferase